ncbi:1359_t:CDS:2, partial [Racocetra fulgida]
MSEQIKKPIKDLFEENVIWARDMKKKNPACFEIYNDQKPKFLWIDPGEIFVFRNIANQFNITDLSALSVIEYTIEELKVDHIIVCDQDGHTGQNGYTGLWVQNIKEVYLLNKPQLDNKTLEDRYKLLVELNVKKQVYNICATDIVQRAWKRGRKVFIHGLVYNIETGLLKDLNVANCLEIFSKPLDFPVDEKIIIQHSELPPVTDELSVTLRFKLE